MSKHEREEMSLGRRDLHSADGAIRERFDPDSEIIECGDADTFDASAVEGVAVPLIGPSSIVPQHLRLLHNLKRLIKNHNAGLRSTKSQDELSQARDELAKLKSKSKSAKSKLSGSESRGIKALNDLGFRWGSLKARVGLTAEQSAGFEDALHTLQRMAESRVFEVADEAEAMRASVRVLSPTSDGAIRIAPAASGTEDESLVFRSADERVVVDTAPSGPTGMGGESKAAGPASDVADGEPDATHIVRLSADGERMRVTPVVNMHVVKRLSDAMLTFMSGDLLHEFKEDPNHQTVVGIIGKLNRYFTQMLEARAFDPIRHHADVSRAKDKVAKLTPITPQLPYSVFAQHGIIRRSSAGIKGKFGRRGSVLIGVSVGGGKSSGRELAAQISVAAGNEPGQQVDRDRPTQVEFVVADTLQDEAMAAQRLKSFPEDASDEKIASTRELMKRTAESIGTAWRLETDQMLSAQADVTPVKLVRWSATEDQVGSEKYERTFRNILAANHVLQKGFKSCITEIARRFRAQGRFPDDSHPEAVKKGKELLANYLRRECVFLTGRIKEAHKSAVHLKHLYPGEVPSVVTMLPEALYPGGDDDEPESRKFDWAMIQLSDSDITKSEMSFFAQTGLLREWLRSGVINKDAMIAAYGESYFTGFDWSVCEVDVRSMQDLRNRRALYLGAGSTSPSVLLRKLSAELPADELLRLVNALEATPDPDLCAKIREAYEEHALRHFLGDARSVRTRGSSIGSVRECPYTPAAGGGDCGGGDRGVHLSSRADHARQASSLGLFGGKRFLQVVSEDHAPSEELEAAAAARVRTPAS